MRETPQVRVHSLFVRAGHYDTVPLFHATLDVIHDCTLWLFYKPSRLANLPSHCNRLIVFAPFFRPTQKRRKLVTVETNLP